VRGVVKATPGDVQRKKALQAQLERRASGIATATAIIGFGLFSHNQLKRAPFYRDGVGRKIDDSVAAGINRVLDATPGIGRARAERRTAGAAVAGAAVSRAAAEAAAGPTALRSQLLGTSNQLETRATAYANSRILFNRLSEVDVKAAALNTNAETWRQQSLEAFWGTKRTGAAGAGDGSTFSEPATHEFLSRQFGFKLSAQATDTDVRRSLTTALNREASSLQALARQQKVNLRDADARQAFLNRLVGPSTANFPDNVRERAVSNLNEILGNEPRSREAALSRRQLAERVYRETRDGFDNYFGRVANEVRQTPGVAMPAEQRRRGYSDLMNSARIGHSRYLAKRLSKPDNVVNRMGQGLSDVLSKEYFATRVNKSSTFTLSDRETLTAASELAGRSITRVSEATSYLQQNGFERLIPVRRAAARRAQAAASQAPQPRSARRRSAAQRIADLMRQKNPDGSPRYATREAAEAALKRMQRKDELPLGLIRTATYLAVRADLRGKGKPCGASHIPKKHECTKGEGAIERKERELYEKHATKAERAYVEKHGRPKDTLSLVEAQIELEKENKQNKTKVNKRAALAVAAIGATAITGAYVIQDMKRVAKEPNMFKPTPSTRTIAKEAKKEFDTKKSGTAMGNYYTQKSGLKPGDVVYYRNEKDPAAHFGIYIGEGKDGKVRAVMANTNEKRAGFVDVMELGTTKPNSNDAAHFMFPVLQKAPPLKNAKARTNEETVRRALRAVGTDYKFSLTRDNCEVLANSVAYDTPRSQQLERFKRLTRRVADSTIGARQRVGMSIRRARGQRVTKALTAQQILQRLSRDDNSFITEEGKALAKAHYSQFFESGTKLDANAPLPEALISPETLWKQVKDYDDDKKAVAVRDYLLVTRLALGA
jgi:hypothetical protein